jgi:TolB protein
MRILILVTTGLALISVVATAQQAAAPFNNGGNPAVSPDGRMIAFTSERGGKPGIYVINQDGTGLRLVAEGQGRPFWSSDGRQLLFTARQGDTATVFSVAIGGGSPKVLGRILARGGLAPFPEGDRFVYGVGPWGTMQLVASGFDGQDRIELTSDQGAYWCHAISPSGRQIAVNRRDSVEMQIWIMNRDGTRSRAVTHLDQAKGSPQCPSWSRDERRLAVQREERDASDPSRGNGSIWIVDLETNAVTQIGAHSSPYLDELPSWFPDGRRIAFQSNRTGQWEVWTMKVDGTDARQLTR